MTYTGFSSSFRISRQFYVLLTVLVVALFLGPISSVSAAGSGQMHPHSPIHGKTSPTPVDQSDHHQGVVCCSAVFCSPSFARDQISSDLDTARDISMISFVIHDVQLRSLYLDSDPPVPKSEISFI
ncbi:MAG: hypothetical protein O3A84_03380 [Proteobacteria bacterium]|nr:hypothetical protein [Pseudomonadota bacterium]